MDKLVLSHEKECDCKPSHLGCATASEWLWNQLSVWEFFYQKGDVRNKHPAPFPLSLAKRVIKLFTHQGELVLDPFCGIGTTALAAQQLQRSCLASDLNPKFITIACSRMGPKPMFTNSRQVILQKDAASLHQVVEDGSVRLVFCSPPYADQLSRKISDVSKKKRGKSYRNYGNHKQANDLGELPPEEWASSMASIMRSLVPCLSERSNLIVNVGDSYKEGTFRPLHSLLIEALKKDFSLRNVIVWDRRNLIHNMRIFGWPSRFITIGNSFEYILHFEPK